MPGWHETTRELEGEGKVRTLGIVQEQHGERTRLFMQWKRMDWPVMVDSLNLLGVSAVPITLLIDEYGIIRAVRPKPDEFERFLSTDYAPMHLEAPQWIDLASLEAKATTGTFEDLRALADSLYLWRRAEEVDRAIEYYQRAVNSNPHDGPSHFRLGVAFRNRYESGARKPGDFGRAITSWKKALSIDPNQYIWRRRIQQYGPRLDKPYSFYDWVTQARHEISSRGEIPVSLPVEPGGAEFAYPTEKFMVEETQISEPDPEGRIYRDDEGMIELETILVPNTKAEDSSFRVHLVFQPNLTKEAHWNNEAGDMVIWLSPPEGWSVDKQHHVLPVPEVATSGEVRRAEFELERLSEPATNSSIPGYALYYICEDVDGTCLFRRRDFVIETAD